MHLRMSITYATMHLAPQFRIGWKNLRAVITQPMRTILGQEKRPIEVDHIGLLRQQHGRRHGQRTGHHAADHDFFVSGPRGLYASQCFSQPAGFIELDIDPRVSLGQGGNIATVVDAFISAKRQANRVKGGFLCLRHRLLKKLTPNCPSLSA